MLGVCGMGWVRDGCVGGSRPRSNERDPHRRRERGRRETTSNAPGRNSTGSDFVVELLYIMMWCPFGKGANLETSRQTEFDGGTELALLRSSVALPSWINPQNHYRCIVELSVERVVVLMFAVLSLSLSLIGSGV